MQDINTRQKDAKPVNIIINEMTRDGKLTINFNQKLKVPEHQRRLQADDQKSDDLPNLNYDSKYPISDIFKIELILHDESENDHDDLSSSNLINPKITEWTEDLMEIELVFKNPLGLSRTASGQP